VRCYVEVTHAPALDPRHPHRGLARTLSACLVPPVIGIDALLHTSGSRTYAQAAGHSTVSLREPLALCVAAAAHPLSACAVYRDAGHVPVRAAHLLREGRPSRSYWPSSTMARDDTMPMNHDRR